MTEATIRIPGNIDVGRVPEEIFYKAFAIAIEKKKKEIKRQLKSIDAKIKKFEKKYNGGLELYEARMGDSFQEHDDWMDWSFLVESRHQLIEEMENIAPA